MADKEIKSNPVTEKTFQKCENNNKLAGDTPSMDYSSRNQFSAWETFKMELKIFMRSENLEKEANSRQVAVFLRLLGKQGRAIFNSFDMNMDTVQLSDLYTAFDRHFDKKKNTASQIFHTYTRRNVDRRVHHIIKKLKLFVRVQRVTRGAYSKYFYLWTGHQVQRHKREVIVGR